MFRKTLWSIDYRFNVRYLFLFICYSRNIEFTTMIELLPHPTLPVQNSTEVVQQTIITLWFRNNSDARDGVIKRFYSSQKRSFSSHRTFGFSPVVHYAKLCSQSIDNCHRNYSNHLGSSRIPVMSLAAGLKLHTFIMQNRVDGQLQPLFSMQNGR